ncbi:MAG: translocation/assembly module TamB domain-containing protein [Candidatus Caldatribacteriaceae bacterium]
MVTSIFQHFTKMFTEFAQADISIERAILRFPLILEVQGVSVRGENFTLFASKGRIGGDLFSLFWRRNFQDKIFVELEDGKFESDIRDPFYWLASLTFTQWPPFKILIRDLRWENFSSLGPLEVEGEHIQSSLVVKIKNKDWETKGFLQEKKNLRWETKTYPNELAIRGFLDFATRRVRMEAETKAGQGILDASLSLEDDLMLLSGLRIESGSLVFDGEGSVKIGGHFPLLLQGTVKHKAKNRGFSVFIKGESISSLWNWEGEGRLQSLDKEWRAEGRILLNGDKKQFSLIFDSFSFSELVGVGEVQGKWVEGKVCLTTQNFHLEMVGGESLLQGKGVVGGNLCWDGENLMGELSFVSPELTFERLMIDNPQLMITFHSGSISISGQGCLFGGVMHVQGYFRNEKLHLEGEVQGVDLEKFVSFPVAGSLSGMLLIEAGRDKRKVILSLTEGELKWKGQEIGEVAGGYLVYQDGKIVGKDLLLRQGNGFLKGNVEIENQKIGGDLKFVDYPFQYRWGDWKIDCLLQGEGHIEKLERGWIMGLSLTSTWILNGKQSGTFVLKGNLRDENFVIDEFSCDWEEGWVHLAGRVKMYQEVDLKGEVYRFSLPVNQFGWSGDLDVLRFVLSGPWQAVDYSLEAEGGNFALQGRTLGEKLIFRLQGVLSLPVEPGENMTWVQYFDPRSLREGEIMVQGVNLSSLGIDLIDRYQGKGVTDLVFRLNTEKQRWNFTSRNFSLSFPDYVDFQGEVRGTYDGQELKVDKLSLVDSVRKVVLQGHGKMGIKDENLDFRLKGEVDTIFPWKNGQWFLSVQGQGTITITGLLKDPLIRGEFFLSKGAVFKGKNEYISFSEIHTEIAKDTLHVLAGKIRTEGAEMDIEGDLSFEEVGLHLKIEGENLFSPWTEILKGNWKGDLLLCGSWDNLQLKGELVLQKGVLDLRKKQEFRSQDLVGILEQWESNFPVTLELVLFPEDILEVKTRFLDLWLGGELKLVGRGKNVQVEGKLVVQKGTYDLVLVKFPLSGCIFFSPLFDLEPQLALEGEKEIHGYRISLAARGGISNYAMILSSDPSLTEEEILSLLFLGQKDSYLALETVNLTPLLLKGLQFLFGGGDTLFSQIPFFDQVELDFANFSQLALAKRLGKNVSLRYTQELGGDHHSSWDVEIDFSREWSIRGEVDSRGVTEWWLEFRTRF